VLALNCDRSRKVVRLALLNVRSDSALITKAESTSIASCDCARKRSRCVGCAHHWITLICSPSSIGSRLGRAKMKALKLSSLSVTTADCCCHLIKSNHTICSWSAGYRVLNKGLSACSHPTKTVGNEQYNQLLVVFRIRCRVQKVKVVMSEQCA
jgi:hypothetical protein